MFVARIRLASLWVSQVARVLGDWCLRIAAFLDRHRSAASAGDAWHVATAVFIAPFVLLAPLNGCINNGLPRRWVLAGSAAFMLLIVTVFAAMHGHWMICLGLVAVGSAIYSPARYAMLPAVAEDTHVPLPRVNGWIEMGGAAAIVGGVALGWAVSADSGMPLAGYFIVVLLGLNVLSLATALPAYFPSDVRRPEPPTQAVAGFFRDSLRIGREQAAWGSLLGLASFQAIITAGSGAVVLRTLDRGASNGLLHAMVLIGTGAGLGCLMAAWQGHPRRSLGLVPLGATGLLLALAWMTFLPPAESALPLIPCFTLGFMGGLINVPLRAAYLAAVPADARGNGTAVMNTAIYVLTTALSLLMTGLVRTGALPTPAAQLGLLAVLAAVFAIVAWRQLYPQAVEQIVEILLTPMYRVRVHGPGRDLMQRGGPLIIIANHAAYCDPFWLCKVVPRKVTPMMTSAFFDLPFIRWAMVHIVNAIRVPVARFRREVPELREAVDVLRQGGCVLIFPEAQLRRRDDQPLRMFGQGVWRILQEVPQAPVLVCWIEGGWRSFTSYYNGLPLRGKWPDWRRHIDIAIDEPRVLNKTLLADQHATRRYLMQTCLECRRYLGLPVLASSDEKAITGSDKSPAPGDTCGGKQQRKEEEQD
ncbi:MAG TPA: MFS transporter [Gemmataceae bacterium]|nr:MFS transporter [Gemmataceae bacterium]